MKNYLQSSFFIALLTLGLFTLFINGCVDKGAPGLFVGVPETPIGKTPEITSLSPANKALAGVTQVTITGKYFSSNPAENIVYFNGVAGKVLSSASTQIVVVPPNVVGNSVEVKISTIGAELFSNNLNYRLDPAVKEIFPITKSDLNDYVPFALTADPNGNVLVSMKSLGIIQVTPLSTDSVSISTYASQGSETNFNDIKYGPGGEVFGARNVRAIFSAQMGSASNAFVSFPREDNASITRLDFDPNGDLWAAGSGGHIYKVNTSDKSYKSYQFADEVTAMRVFKVGSAVYLYVAAKADNNTKIQRMQIDSNGDLGQPEDYFDFSAKYAPDTAHVVNAIDFAVDGDMYLGTDLKNPIVVVHPDKSSEYLYPDLLAEAPVYSFAWGAGTTYLYYTREEVSTIDPNDNKVVEVTQTIVRLDLEKQGAPYYGQ